jgi:predicted ATPase
VTVLSIEEIAERLDDALQLLVTGSRLAPPRQQTQRATLDWSCRLVSEPERELFVHLSVFAGGWLLSDAEMVCARPVIPREAVLNLLAGLVKKSLVVAEPDADGRFRYRLLEPVRQYARERLLETAAVDLVQEQHAQHFLELAERAEAAQIGDRLAAVLTHFWAIGGHPREDLSRLDATGASGGETSAARAMLLAGSGWLALLRGDLTRARTDLESSLALVRQLHDTQEIAETLKNLSRVALQECDLALARRCFAESLMLSHARGY